MAIRTTTSPKLLHPLRYLTRPLNSSLSSLTASEPTITATAAATDAAADSAADAAAAQPPPPSILDFTDTKNLYQSLSTLELLHASAMLHAAAVGPVVDVGMWVMRSKLMDTFLVRDAILRFVKHTFYEHFCAGESAEEAGKTMRRLKDARLRGMLDYALEYATDNEACDRNLNEFLKTVESSKSLPPSSVSFVVVKISAICPIQLLERVSHLLRWEYKKSCFHLPWKLNTFPIFSASSPTYHTLKQPQPLSPQEEHDLQLIHQRLETLSQKCLEANVPLLVDAEDTLYQPAIDYFTYNSAITNNKDDNPIVFGTIQAYLKDAKERLLLASKAAEKMGVPMGFKLVRGAYMSSERKLASSLGFDSPIHNSIEETHACYNDCASFLLDKIASGTGSVVLASHNVETGRLAATRARDLGIRKGNQKLEFAQLYGMSDALSYSLRNAGFQVSKYTPFGPVEQVIPYLLRRAEENRGLLSASTLDRQLMRKELTRRLCSSMS